MSDTLRRARHVREVTKRYWSLQGLKQVPIGLALIALPLVTGSFLTGPTYQAALWVLVPILLLAPLLYLTATRYYAERFGELKRTMTGQERRAVIYILGGGVLLVIAAQLLAGSGLESGVPISLTQTAFFGGFIAIVRIYIPHLPHYQWMGFAALLIALTPFSLLFDLPTHPFDMGGGNAVALIVFGIIVIAGGFRDHYLLVSYMPGETSSTA